MICRCGEKLSNTQAPNDIELTVYTDREWDEMFSGYDSIAPHEIPLPRYNVWRCPKCARIYVFEGSDSSPVMVYAIEKEQ